MVAVHTPIDKQTIRNVVDLRAVFTVDVGLVETIQRHSPGWVAQRIRVNDLSPLWPESLLRKPALEWARRFVEDMVRRGFELAQNEADVWLSGPFLSKGYGRVEYGKGISRTENEELFPDMVDFLLEAKFVTKRVRMVEIKERPSWALLEETVGHVS